METTTPPQLDQPGIIYHYAAKVERDGVWGVQPITKVASLHLWSRCISCFILY